jgi:hypothetical protein
VLEGPAFWPEEDGWLSAFLRFLSDGLLCRLVLVCLEESMCNNVRVAQQKLLGIFFPVSLSCSSLVNCVEAQRGTVKTNEMYRTYIWWGVLLYRPAILSHSTDLGRPLHCLPSQAHTLLNCGAGQYACSKRNKIRGTTPYRYQLAGMALQKPAPAGEVAHRIDHPSLQRTGRQTLSASRPALRWTEN